MKNPNILPKIQGGEPVQTIKVTTLNGVEIDAVVLEKITDEIWVCYAQNRLFTVNTYFVLANGKMEQRLEYGLTINDYCIIPEYEVE